MKNEIKIFCYKILGSYNDEYVAHACIYGGIIIASHISRSKDSAKEDMLRASKLEIYNKHFPDGYSITFEGELVYEKDEKDEKEKKIRSYELINDFLGRNLSRSIEDLKDNHFTNKGTDLLQEAVSFYLDKLRAEG